LAELSAAAAEAGNHELAFALERANRNVAIMLTSMQRYIGKPSRSRAVGIQSARRDAQNAIKAAAEMASDTSMKEGIDAALKHVKSYRLSGARLVMTLNSLVAAKRGQMDSRGPQMQKVALELQDGVFGALSEMADRTHDKTGRIITLTGGLAVAALVLGLVIAILVTRAVVRPVKRGHREIVALLESIEAGNADLNTRLTPGPKDEIGNFIAGVNRFLGTLQQVITSIAGESDHLAGSADRLAGITRRTEEGADAQRREMEQVATAMNEMAATAQEIAKNTSEAATAAGESSKATEEGRKVVHETVDAIDGLAQEVEHGANSVVELRNESDSIGTVLDVIREVAEQTNLLALNAAIEAARAGEHGRGFAVVADEVRTLAKRVQDSTGQIQEIIERLQNSAEAAAKNMNTSRETAQKTVEKAARAGDALSSIAESVNRINDMNSQVAGAAEEQTATSESINQSVVRASDAGEETSRAVREVNQATSELTEMGQRLRELVGRFHG
ncbi:MAG: methyl-accepting chemotaxis protein, partial [Ectothiorhodospiraceae bacterium]|jgi:methyl-accepting chemotaxis protein